LKLFSVALATVTYASFVWAAMCFFKTGNSGSKRGKLLIGLMGFASVLICIAALLQSTWQQLPMQWLGVALFLLSFAVFWWAIGTVRSAPLDFAFSTRPPHRLVTRGPYAYWRHPFYASYSFGWLGAALVAQSVWPLVVTVAMGFVYWRAALSEERNFKSGELGNQYQRYSEKSKLLIPWII
jgi:protein-S-isoprenylcysteine O-methyltransferase Ste14